MRSYIKHSQNDEISHVYMWGRKLMGLFLRDSTAQSHTSDFSITENGDSVLFTVYLFV